MPFLLVTSLPALSNDMATSCSASDDNVTSEPAIRPRSAGWMLPEERIHPFTRDRPIKVRETAKLYVTDSNGNTPIDYLPGLESNPAAFEQADCPKH